MIVRATIAAALAGVRVLAALAALLLAPCGARADSFPSAASDSHAWVLMSLGDPEQRVWGLYHLSNELAPAVVRFGPQILGRPDRLAAHGNRLVLVYEPPASTEQADDSGRELAGPRVPEVRRVETLTVAPGRTTGFYEYRPVGRRPESWPALPARGSLGGITLSEHGAFSLILPVPDDSEAEEPELLRLVDLAWESIPLPSFELENASLRLVPGAPVLAMLSEKNGHATLWRLNADGRSWSSEQVDRASGADGVAMDPAGRLLVYRYDKESKRLSVETIERDRAVTLASIDGVGVERVVLPAGERLTVLWRDGEQAARFQAAVISTISGEQLYTGRLQADPVVSGRDLQTLALLLGAILLTVLIFVLRADPTQDDVVKLPEGFALAAPLRRFIATVIDLGLPLVLIAVAFDVRLNDALAAAFLLESADLEGGAAFVAALSVAILHSTLGEWRFGRSFGKAMLGLRVFSSARDEPAGSVRFWQAVVRNAVKYLCPPLAVFVLLDPRRRHPADLLARAIVAQRAPVHPPDEGN